MKCPVCESVMNDASKKGASNSEHICVCGVTVYDPRVNIGSTLKKASTDELLKELEKRHVDVFYDEIGLVVGNGNNHYGRAKAVVVVK